MNVKKAVHYFPWTVWTVSFLLVDFKSVEVYFWSLQSQLVSWPPPSCILRTGDCPFPHFPESCGALALVIAKHPLSCLFLDSNWQEGDHLPIIIAGKPDLRTINLLSLLLTRVGTAHTQDMPAVTTWHSKMWAICTYSYGLGLTFKASFEIALGIRYLTPLEPTVLAKEKPKSKLLFTVK